MKDVKKPVRLESSLRLLGVLSIALWLTACASSPVALVDTTNTEVIDYPQVGEVVTRGLGERLVAKGIRVTGPALHVRSETQFNKKEGEGSIMTCALTVPAGTYFKRGIYDAGKDTPSFGGDCFGPVQAILSLADGTTNWNCPGTIVSAHVCRGRDDHYFLVTIGTVQIPLEQDFQNLNVTTGVIEDTTNFVQELVYNGRVDNYLRFIYREFSNELARPSFTQEAQYDLSESTVIGFKDLRMEILDASNTEITYRLISNFK